MRAGLMFELDDMTKEELREVERYVKGLLKARKRGLVMYEGRFVDDWR